MLMIAKVILLPEIVILSCFPDSTITERSAFDREIP